MIGNNTKFDGVENYYIDFANNDLFRASQDASNDGYIYDRQIDTAKEIVKKFLNKVTRRNHIILFSEMQSGKTGTLNATINIIHELNLERNMGIDRYMIITGMNDTYLKSQTYERLISQVKEANDEVIYLAVASGLSGTYQSACIAKDIVEYDGIHIIDTNQVTVGTQILAEIALKLVKEGKNVEEIISEVTNLCSKVKLMAGLDTLEYLAKGGRISSAVATIGNMAKLKPIIAINQEGKIDLTTFLEELKPVLI